MRIFHWYLLYKIWEVWLIKISKNKLFSSNSSNANSSHEPHNKSVTLTNTRRISSRMMTFLMKFQWSRSEINTMVNSLYLSFLHLSTSHTECQVGLCVNGMNGWMKREANLPRSHKMPEHKSQLGLHIHPTTSIWNKCNLIYHNISWYLYHRRYYL